MYYEEPRTPALPGEENVTDGSVDDYGTDWENVDNGALEEEMAKCAATPCDAKTTCPDNDPEQTDAQMYEMISESYEAVFAVSAERLTMKAASGSQLCGGRAGFSLLLSAWHLRPWQKEKREDIWQNTIASCSMQTTRC